MFETIPVDIRTSADHGGVVLLESFHFADGELTVRVFAPGSGDCGELHFSDVVGLTLHEDLPAPPPAPDGAPARSRGTAPAHGRPGGAARAGFFERAEESPMSGATRTAPGLGAHRHYRLRLREHALSFVAGPDYEITVAAQSRAN